MRGRPGPLFPVPVIQERRRASPSAGDRLRCQVDGFRVPDDPSLIERRHSNGLRIHTSKRSSGDFNRLACSRRINRKRFCAVEVRQALGEDRDSMIPVRDLFENHLTMADLIRSTSLFGQTRGLELAAMFWERRAKPSHCFSGGSPAPARRAVLRESRWSELLWKMIEGFECGSPANSGALCLAA